jgi:5-methylcytosine-specific restriction endonuclease McrA
MRKKYPECQLCGKRKSEEVHHIFPFMHQFEDIREEVFLDKDNLICLCSDCHHQVHAKNYGNLGIPERIKIEKLRN